MGDGGGSRTAPTNACYDAVRVTQKGLVKRLEDWRWSSYNNFDLDKATVAACPIQINDVRLPLGYIGH